jgi:predicted metal-dependent HD superfamily phosphohydrolase
MMINQTKILSYIKKIVKEKMPHNKYHNYNHALETYKMVHVYGEEEKVKPRELFLLEVASLFHDIVYVYKRRDNENKSAKIARETLMGLGFNTKDILLVEQLILSTTYPPHPKTKLERIICDADVSNVGTDSFFKRTEGLRKDFKLDKKTYYTINLKNFITNFKFYTRAASKLGKKRFLENKKKALKIIKSYSS